MEHLKPEFIMRSLAVVFPVFYTALDIGVFKAKEFFETQEHEENKTIDRYLAPSIVRYYAIQHLKQAGQDVYDDNYLDEINIADVPNNGIHINSGRYQIKILKSNRGDIPVPGHSKMRQDFYDQQFLDFPDMKNNNSSIINLLFLWNTNYNYEGLGTLTLACPKSGKETRQSVEHHFHCKIPTALLYGEYKFDDEIIYEEMFDDLPLDNINLDETGTETDV